MVLALFLSLWTLVACDSSTPDNSPDGDTVDGDISDGDVIDGDSADGDAMDGDVIDGDSTDGDLDEEISDGDVIDGDTDSEAEEETIDPANAFDPWAVMESDELPLVRGMRTWRGIVHTHSPYSHDACDDEPFIDGVRNEQCYLDVRAGMCLTAQDYVFLTDHSTLFADYEFPEVLLYQEGDTLITREERPVANRLACPDGRSVIVSAGTESAMMPIGIERHVADTPEARKAIYNSATVDSVQALREVGAKVFLQHTEEWDVETILDLDVDGIEMYNVHFNLMDNLGEAVKMALKMETAPEELPAIELALIAVFQENDADLYRWSKVLMTRDMPAVLATDSHRNVFKGPSPDGERLDSFRRLMRWYSNYVLVPDGPVDDKILKETIAAGRLYGVFDYLGYALDFDFHAEAGELVVEMGEHVDGDEANLLVTMPEIWGLNPASPLQPELRSIILKANDGEWETVAEGLGDLSATVGPGAYRAEIRMVPNHLRPWLGPFADDYIKEWIWIYSNVIYVGAAPTK
jgi:hypothetical protein